MLREDEFMASLGFPETYRVGGSVRDELLGVEPKDADYMVRGVPLGEIESAATAAGAKARRLQLRDGRQVGWRLSRPGQPGVLEVTLPRKEISTGSGHRDFEIRPSPKVTVGQDALRRDFTFNALYRNVHDGVIVDPLRGQEDLQHRWVRTTHPASFRDDPLRILRALRFVSTLGFELVEDTFREMRDHARSVTALTLKGVSNTALDELCKLLMGDHAADALRLMCGSGVLPVLLPELASIVNFDQRSDYHGEELHEHTFAAVGYAARENAPLDVRMALLFHDAGKPWMAWGDSSGSGLRHYYALEHEQIVAVGGPPTAMFSHEWWGAWLAGRALGRLNAPNGLRRNVVTLVERHMVPLERVKAMKVRKWRSEIGDEMLRKLFLHRRCDVLAKDDDGEDFDTAFDALNYLAGLLDDAIEKRVPATVGDLKIKGDAICVPPGARVGEIQRQLLHEVMAAPKLNTPEWLQARAGKLAT